MLSLVVLRAAFSWEEPPDVDFLIRIFVLLKGCVVLFWSALMSSRPRNFGYVCPNSIGETPAQCLTGPRGLASPPRRGLIPLPGSDGCPGVPPSVSNADGLSNRTLWDDYTAKKYAKKHLQSAKLMDLSVEFNEILFVGCFNKSLCASLEADI